MRNVVLIVDMLKGFYNIGALANPRMANIIPNVVELLDSKSKQGYELIFVRDRHKPDDKEFETWPPHCIEGTKEAEIIDELKEFTGPHKKNTEPPIYLLKTRYSGFFETELEYLLRTRKKPEQVIVVGVCTDICILHTVADLRMRDYKVIVPKDCVETFDSPEHPADETNKWALGHMKNILGAEIVERGKQIE